jgi:hypothetical protein
LGYFLADLIGDSIDTYILPIIGLIVIVSLVPPLLEWRRHSGCPEQAANLEAYRLREMAGVLIEIADRYLDASVVLMSPAESARIGAASRLAERALRIVECKALAGMAGVTRLCIGSHLCRIVPESCVVSRSVRRQASAVPGD